MNAEWFIAFFVGSLLLIGPTVAFILALVAYVRSNKIQQLSERVQQLEKTLSSVVGQRTVAVDEPPVVIAEATQVLSEAQASSPVDLNKPAPAAVAAGTAPIGWEAFVGQRAFGWIAVILFVFASAFFLRYAYQNNWIGPLGQVAIGELVGIALVIAAWRHVTQGWRRFAGMLTAAGAVVLYLATFSAFAIYRLLPQHVAGLFLAMIVAESLMISVLYRSLSVAIVSVIGGLLTPILMASDVDNYQALFVYLVTLNLGVMVALQYRAWPAVLPLIGGGTQLLFWIWYHSNYHPEKFAWAIGFNVVLFAAHILFALQGWAYTTVWLQWERLVVFALNALLSFITFRALTVADYGHWQGALAMIMAVIYAQVAYWALRRGTGNTRLPLTSLAISIGFVAWTFPIQADAHWVAVGWSAMALALWIFGLRITNNSLKCLAACLAVMSMVRVIGFDLLLYVRDPFIPVFNGVALPSLCAGMCILVGVLFSERWRRRLHEAEQWAITLFAIAGMILVWLVLSLDCYGYFVSQSIVGGDISVWRLRGQLALTVMWTVLATMQLIAGFYFQRPRLRWFAMALFAVTVVKVFVVDMANVQQLYRIAAFFVLAVVLGLVARSYQRFRG